MDNTGTSSNSCKEHNLVTKIIKIISIRLVSKSSFQHLSSVKEDKVVRDKEYELSRYLLFRYFVCNFCYFPLTTDAQIKR